MPDLFAVFGRLGKQRSGGIQHVDQMVARVRHLVAHDKDRGRYVRR
jgi:hypothetical protein